MKTTSRIFSLATLLAAGLGFSACSDNSSNAVIDEPEVNPTAHTYFVTLDASKGSDASGIAANDKGILRALSESGNVLTATWAAGEEVTVYNNTQSAALTGTLTAQSSGESVVLKGELTSETAIKTGDELLLKFCSDDYTSQNGTLAYIAANCDYATATVTVSSVTSSSFTVNEIATFESQQAIIKFTLKDASTAATINPSAFTISDGTSTMTLSDIPSSTYTTNGDGIIYVAFPASGSSATISLTATVDETTYTFEKTGITFSNAEFWPITVSMARQSSSLPEGAIGGKFTVDASGTQVYFSQGNLQATYDGDGDALSDWTWKFAEHQYDYIGDTSKTANGNGNITVNGVLMLSAAGTIDLFAYEGASSLVKATTSKETKWYGINNSTTQGDYGTVANEALMDDWGNLAITNGGNAANSGWRTLTGGANGEWAFLFNTRETGGKVGETDQARYTEATIYTDDTDDTGVNGIILFPDGVDFASSEFAHLDRVNGISNWATKCTSAQWTALEAKGCVFLPAGGNRAGTEGTTVKDAGSQGYYWSSNNSSSISAYQMRFNSYEVKFTSANRSYGRNVRLVREVK